MIPNYPESIADSLARPEAQKVAVKSVCANNRLSVSQMVRYSRQCPRQSECLLETWYRLRRDSAASLARARDARLEDAEDLVLTRMQEERP